MEKICTRCKLPKSLDQFYNGKTKDGKQHYCKACSKLTHMLWSRSNPDKDRAITQRKLYGIEPEETARLFKEQEGKCAICQQVVRLGVDHCHKTNRVRGLLCNACNVGIGHLRDSIEILQAAIAYLSK